MNPTQGVKLLIADHRGQGTATHLAPMASAGLEVTTSVSLGRTLTLLESDAPDAIVLDPLAGGGSVELEKIQNYLKRTHTGLLVVSDPIDSLPTIRALRALGNRAYDLVPRGAPLEEFQLRIDHLSQRVFSHQELEEARYRAMHDDLTDLLRPRAFNHRLFEHFSATQRHGLPMALVLMDLDRFGSINKRFNHTIGDRLIAEVGRAILDFLRAEDVGGRLGGDEFGMILPYTNRVDAARVVHRVRQRIERISGRLDPLETIRVSTSLGFETFNGQDLDSVVTLREHAETALKKAKARGGNCGVYYRAPDDEEPAWPSSAPATPLAPDQDRPQPGSAI
ncbi:MAG: GGDEF domain-containing protein [Planctomycetes bacterium]|nr:GGDEF domain-containing protein [Planctomycetota bacterium]MCB9909463.1 GGDEF domain-containing protein [Planctomycetota bacterium]HPF13850.1 GGDEF domain-containing protein [Planctomycetota bacterium]